MINELVYISAILKWELIAYGFEADHSDNCALCNLFHDNDCKLCPVSEYTGVNGCHNSPYYEFDSSVELYEEFALDLVKTPRERQQALDEMFFLKLLLPKE